MSPIYVPGKVTLAKEFTQQNYMWEFPAQYGLWSPANITTALWLDAADASTVTTVSGAVSQWNDKSGNSRNFAQSTPSARPAYVSTGLNGKPTLAFQADDFMELSSSRISSTFTVVVVANANALDVNTVLFAGSSKTNGNPRDQIDRLNADVRMVSRNDATTVVAPSQGTLTTADYIQSATTSSTLAGVALNGAALTTASAPGGTYSISVYTIGGLYAGSSAISAFHNGDISELVYVAGEPSTNIRQRLEGYLAHKWGLTANLPNDHPYKLVGPTP